MNKQLIFSTKVNAPSNVVWNHFNQDLFDYLQPPFPPTKILRYDGNRRGDEVHIELDLIFRKELWISRIMETKVKNKGTSYFVDEGVQLPFFLDSWRHIHEIQYIDSQTSRIVDRVSLSMKNSLVPLFLPGIYMQFWFRIPLYKRYYKELMKNPVLV